MLCLWTTVCQSSNQVEAMSWCPGRAPVLLPWAGQGQGYQPLVTMAMAGSGCSASLAVLAPSTERLAGASRTSHPCGADSTGHILARAPRQPPSPAHHPPGTAASAEPTPSGPHGHTPRWGGQGTAGPIRAALCLQPHHGALGHLSPSGASPSSVSRAVSACVDYGTHSAAHRAQLARLSTAWHGAPHSPPWLQLWLHRAESITRRGI